MTTTLNDTERSTVRDAALGALAMVSRAESGFFAMFKESMAGSQVLKSAPEAVRELLTAPGLPTPPAGKSAEEVEASVLAQLGSAVSVLKEKAPEQLQGFQQVILAACDAVASAAKGVSAEESAIIAKVRSALGGAV